MVDASALATGDAGAIATLVAAFAQAHHVTGFGYVTNHGIPPALVDRVFEANVRFHALPRDAKLAVELNHLHRGFIPINTSTDVTTKLAVVSRPNQSESFMMMREDGPHAPEVVAGAYLAGPNQ
ncbi:MAG: 2-oxoglutarate and iron-dependent oxygenase domain-containing protein [Gammaproteobacteria bacterium]